MDPRETASVEQVPAATSSPATTTSAVAIVEAATPRPPPALPCANCGTTLSGPFCAQCGQHIADYHRSIRRLVGDFFDTVFSWDSKILRTLGPLFQRPGFLTIEFMSGRRVRYVQPLKLFLFTSAVCLTLIHFGGGDEVKRASPKARNHGTKGEHGVRAREKESGITMDFTAGDKASPAEEEPSASPAPSAMPSATPGTSPGETPLDRAAIKAAVRDALKGKPGDKDAQAVTNLAEHLIDATAAKIDARGGVQRSIDAVSENFRQRLSWVALAMLPIFALMLRSLYWRKDIYYFAHLIFSLHYHTFLLIFLTVYLWLSVMVSGTLAGVVTTLLMFAPPGYLFLALRRVYGGGVRRTWTKTFVLGALHLLAIFAGLCVIGASSLVSALR